MRKILILALFLCSCSYDAVLVVQTMPGASTAASPTASLMASTEAVPAPSPTELCKATVNAANGQDGALNFRRGPGTEFQVLAVLADGETVEVIVPLSGWHKVRIMRQGLALDGYVKSEYLEGCR